MEDAADEWWRNLPERERTWHQFKEALRGRFYPISIKNAKYEEYVKLVQGKMTVKEYYDKFRELIRFSPDANASEQAIAQKFEFGLNAYIREAFGGKQFDSLQKVYDRAITVERVRQLKRKEIAEQEAPQERKNQRNDKPRDNRNQGGF